MGSLFDNPDSSGMMVGQAVASGLQGLIEAYKIKLGAAQEQAKLTQSGLNAGANAMAMAGYHKSLMDEKQYEWDHPKTTTTFAPAGQAIPLEGGHTVYTDGKGGFKELKTGGAGAGGVLKERQGAAGRFLDQLQAQLDHVSLPTGNGEFGRPVSWLSKLRAWQNSSSAPGQLLSLVNTGGPTVAAGVSNRVNEGEMKRQLEAFGNEALSRTKPANIKLINEMRSILNATDAYVPDVVSPPPPVDPENAPGKYDNMTEEEMNAEYASQMAAGQ